jgi:GDP-4-dehydro-6-deoxy-D-mannose reductase
MEYDLIKVSSKKLDRVDENHPLGPASPYAVSKVVQDLLSYSYYQSYDLNIIRARPFNHIGERQTKDFVVSAFSAQIAAIEQGKQTTIKVGNLASVRDFSDVKDVVLAYMLLMNKGKKGEVYNIGTGEGHAIKEVLDLLLELAKTKIKVVTDPTKMRPADVPVVIANADKIKKLGWEPKISLKETLKRILNYWRTNI